MKPLQANVPTAILAASKGAAMARVLNGRHMADVSELGDEVVVFIVGMRLNKPLKLSRWWPVVAA